MALKCAVKRLRWYVEIECNLSQRRFEGLDTRFDTLETHIRMLDRQLQERAAGH